MKTKIVIVMILMGALPALGKETSKCLSNADLPGREEMVKEFVSGDHSHASDKFRKFCEANAQKVVCKTVVTTKKETKNKAADLIKLSKCAEVTTIPNASKDTNTIYFYMPK